MGETLTLKPYEYGDDKKDDYDQFVSGFMGWNTKINRTGKAYDDNDAFTYDGSVTTLYAQWSGEELSGESSTAGVYRVTYYSDNDELYDEGQLPYTSSPYELKTLDRLIEYAKVQQSKDITVFIPAGKQLAGWRTTKDPDDPDARVYQPGEKMTLTFIQKIDLYAIWEDKEVPTPTPTSKPDPTPTSKPDPTPTSVPTPTSSSVPTPAPASTPETPQVPQTGDGAQLGLWMALMVISCIGAAAIVLLRSKERRN